MARSSRFKKSRNSDSKLHQRTREILSNLFPVSNIYEEYPLDKILEKGYKTQNLPEEAQNKFLLNRARKLRCDFCILNLSVVIEVQGEHHFEDVQYNKKAEPKGQFEHRLHLDKMKRLIYKEAEFRLLEIPYWEIRDKENSYIEKFIMERL